MHNFNITWGRLLVSIYLENSRKQIPAQFRQRHQGGTKTPAVAPSVAVASVLGHPPLGSNGPGSDPGGQKPGRSTVETCGNPDVYDGLYSSI